MQREIRSVVGGNGVPELPADGAGHVGVRVREGHGPNKIKNLTGVKAREFLVWINLTEICVAEGDDSLAGLSKSFPLSLFGGIKAQTLVFRKEVAGSNEGNWCNKLKLLGFSWERVERGLGGEGNTRSYLFW
ncbi:hypothetical protein SLEP1_g47851 [Rubroshorea leprosula]|uniref:LAGLIDADG homing endonuclease n=1 Tax=Rubroshorea leprosula TaxID=152421 RepID=A0AAV5LSP7_9ROSI|nr:hypothetical protein SLEP1_g47851 [Rubroshorea leprosula]